MEYIRFKHQGETILTVDNQEAKKVFLGCIMDFETEMTQVTLKTKDGETKKANKFVVLQTEGLQMEKYGLFFLFPKGTEIYVYK